MESFDSETDFKDIWWGESLGNPLAVQGLGLGTFTVRARVDPGARELRSHMLCGTAK